MSKLYKINEQYAIYRDNESTLFAVSEDGGIILDDKVYSDIVNFLLFKHASLEQIIYNFLLVHPPAVLLRAFKHLCSSKVICPVDSNSELSISENISKLMSEKFKPIFKSLNAIELDQEYSIRSMLEQQSFKLSDLANLSVVVVNDYLDLRLDKINQKFRKKKKKWLLFKPFGKQIMVGPIFSPADNNFCWECLAYRLKMHRPFTYLQDNVKRIIQWPKPIMTELSLNVAIDLLQQRLIDLDYKGITGYSTILSLNLTTGQLDSYQVYKRPQCSKCGIAQKVNYSSLQINAKSPVNDYGGGYRSVSPQKTYLKYQHLVSPVTGIIPNIIEYSQSESALIHNYSSGRNLALQSKSLFWLNNHLRSCNGGKGKSKWQAKTGALCEAIERYSMIYHGQQPCKSSTSFVELGDTAIHPNRCMNFSESQFVNREAINQQCSAFYSLVPVKFDPYHRVDWTSVYSLVDHTIKYLPSAFCYAQYPHDDEKALIAYPDSNGCAAGNTHAEAILQGTFELIERDAAAIWWYNKIPRAEVDLQCIGNDYITSIIQFYKSKGRALYVLDITTDFNIPTFVAISYKLSNGKGAALF
ncbi:TOMM precursor leader peptide-binding protein [Zooshikella ganghwensis]|uniref:YcaO domain-containing protein n=1 Tax=Zooshikella ganghwensis TaxID=202772 RepID=A0A4P9VSD8_9GAMM|nr:TOMM precursor leader peptide-binding protein [Zooshikella ganghwensis]RDH44920.1 hypothetical protein B9G39_16590 [Zooshikella ganghwensis]